MKAFATHFSFVFKTGLRNSNLLMINYLFPFGFYVAMGLVMTKINPLFAATMVPALGVFAIVASTVLGLPAPVVEDREAGIFRSYKINGVPALSILVIPAITTMFHAMIAASVIVFSAPLLFDGVPPEDWLTLWAILLLTAFACAGIGSLIAVISKDSRATVLWSQLIFLPAMLIGGLMIPLDVLPSSVLPASLLLPTTHAMQAAMGLAYGEATVLPPMIAVGVLFAAGLAAFAMATYLFNWDSHNASRRGHPLMALLAWLPYALSIMAL
ncbi:MAG: ABC transporter permease [Anaerolineales bacterium]